MASSNDSFGAERASGSDDASTLKSRRASWLGDRGSSGADDADDAGSSSSSAVSTRSGSGSGKTGSGKGGSGKGTSRTAGSSSRGSGASTRGKSSSGPRRIRLTLARLDPFSVMKISFLVAIAIGIATVVCVAVLWNLVNAMGVWSTLDQLGKDLNNNKPLPFMEYFKFGKMLSYSVIIAFINVVIITALGTLFAFLYNIVASLLGGLRMTFTDE